MGMSAKVSDMMLQHPLKIVGIHLNSKKKKKEVSGQLLYQPHHSLLILASILQAGNEKQFRPANTLLW